MSEHAPRFLISIPPREPMDEAVIAASARACRRALAASVSVAMMLGAVRLAQGGSFGALARTPSLPLPAIARTTRNDRQAWRAATPLR